MQLCMLLKACERTEYRTTRNTTSPCFFQLSFMFGCYLGAKIIIDPGCTALGTVKTQKQKAISAPKGLWFESETRGGYSQANGEAQGIETLLASMIGRDQLSIIYGIACATMCAAFSDFLQDNDDRLVISFP